MCWIHRIIVAYMVATTMHVPCPVFDGDNLKSGEAQPTNTTVANDTYDVDFILLGCDPPDDSDDGPVDDDREDGAYSIFGPLHSVVKTGPSHFWICSCHYDFVWSRSRSNGPLRSCKFKIEFVFRQFSFGKLCQSGAAHQRC